MPSLTSTTSARILVSMPSVTNMLTSWLAKLNTPRARWYLKLRPNTFCPAAHKALEMVSPSKAVKASPSKVKFIFLVRSSHSPFCLIVRRLIWLAPALG